ncbi:unnamed protein product [Allacma fusca]|uniref:Uncharacterized protein n=1 Tax=Allacma fusca TaxID=39272 RepID=A0A8J2LLV8_9HEXA|nr:unnamed protein product [Allacma fusca]
MTVHHFYCRHITWVKMSGHPYSPRAYSIDCEMADVEDVFSGVGRAKKFPIKVVIVDERLDVIYDRLVRPDSTVLNDNSFIHGINMKSVIQKEQAVEIV